MGCTTAAVEWRLIVHHEFEQDSDHTFVDEVCCYLEVWLRKIFEQIEELVETSPIDTSPIHHSFDEQFDKPQRSRLLIAHISDFKPIDRFLFTFKVSQLLMVSEVRLLILDCNCKCGWQQIREDLSHLCIWRTKEHFLQHMLLFCDPFGEPDAS